MRIATTKLWWIYACIGYAFCLLPVSVYAQYTNAADYPFIAGQEKFEYVTGGTPVAGIHTDDAAVTNIPIGFNFPFCGTTYTTGSASSNGWFSLSVSTGTGLGVNNNNTLFSQFGTNNSLPVFMPLWDDLGYFIGSVPLPAASYITTGVAPNRVFTFEWKAWGWDFSPIPGSFTMQLKLYESGSFKYAYKREGGPVASSQAVNTEPNWFGASIGFAKTLNDFQFLDGSTPFSLASTAAAFKINIDSRPFTGQAYTWMAPCTGVQSARVVIPDADVCPGTIFRLAAVIDESEAISNNCVWYYSEDGGAWSTLSATTGVITDNITSPRWYKAKVTCGAQSYTTPPVLVKISDPYKCQCKSASTVLTSATASAMDIGNMNLINESNNDTIINNYEPSLSLTANIYSVKGYSDFTREFDQLPTIYRDSLYRLNVNAINYGQTASPGVVTAFIDYNGDGIYQDFERIIYGQSANILPAPYAVNDTFRVSDTAKTGFARMRVILRAGTTYPDSCGNYAEGETEDYLVKIDYPPCSGPVNAGHLAGEDTTMCPGYTYLLTDTTYEKTYSGLLRSWQHSGDGVNWYDMPNTADKDSIIRIFANQPLHYRVKMTCTHTADITYSDTFKINIKPGYKCYCYSQAEGGVEFDTSDIGAVHISTLNVNDGGTHLRNIKAHRPRTDRTDMAPLELDVDSIYNFFIYHTMPREDHADAKITVFFDFDNNHQYDIPYERVFTGFTAIGYHTVVNNLIIPNNVIVDVPTGMRIVLNNNVAPNIPSDEACGPYTSGETEDFIVVFKRPFPESVKDVNTIEHFSVFPNPTQGRVTIQFSNNTVTDVSILIKDITGRQVLQQAVNHTGGIFRHEVDLSAYPKGIYMVEVNAGNNHFVQKLSVQ